MAIAIVQSAKAQPASTGTSVDFTLGVSPTAGNILVAFTGYSQSGAVRSLTSAAGTWTKIDDLTLNNDSLSDWWHVVVGGDGTTWSFPISGTAEWRSGVMYELSGVDPTTPINQHSIVTGVNLGAGTAITPSVLNCQALSAINTDAGSNSAQGVIGVSSGWTNDQNAIPSFHSTLSASLNALTSDTTTAINNTWNLVTGGDMVAAMLLLQPATVIASKVPYQPAYLMAPILAQ